MRFRKKYRGELQTVVILLCHMNIKFALNPVIRECKHHAIFIFMQSFFQDISDTIGRIRQNLTCIINTPDKYFTQKKIILLIIYNIKTKL